MHDVTPAAIDSITAAKLLVGVAKADTPERHARHEFVAAILAAIPIIDFSLPQARLFAAHFAESTRRGEKIGDHDLPIAVTAMSIGFELATLNVREFERVVGLRLINVARYESR